MFKVKLYTHCKKSTIVKIEITKFRCRTFKLKKKSIKWVVYCQVQQQFKKVSIFSLLIQMLLLLFLYH